jgi:hypothetical protein
MTKKKGLVKVRKSAACITAAFPLLLKLSTFVLVKLKGFPIFTLDMFLAF